MAKGLGSTFGQSQDTFAVSPVMTYRKYYGNQESGSIQVQATRQELMQAAEDEARQLMRAHRHIGAKAEDNFGLIEPSAIMGLWQNLTSTLAATSVGIVMVFMLIAAIVIMNVMLASVTEGSREIGVRKSVGATRRDVLLQFLVESSVMAAIGGIIGIIVAAGITFAITHLFSFPMALPVRWFVGALLLATSIGVFFGVYPAYKAGKLDPIEALRFEV